MVYGTFYLIRFLQTPLHYAAAATHVYMCLEIIVKEATDIMKLYHPPDDRATRQLHAYTDAC